MKVLTPADQEHVRKASLLLRLARSLNLGRSAAVERAQVQVRNGSVQLKLVPRQKMGVDLELWAIEKDRSYFREIFSRELSVAAA